MDQCKITKDRAKFFNVFSKGYWNFEFHKVIISHFADCSVTQVPLFVSDIKCFDVLAKLCERIVSFPLSFSAYIDIFHNVKFDEVPEAHSNIFYWFGFLQTFCKQVKVVFFKLTYRTLKVRFFIIRKIKIFGDLCNCTKRLNQLINDFSSSSTFISSCILIHLLSSKLYSYCISEKGEGDECGREFHLFFCFFILINQKKTCLNTAKY